MKHYYYSDPLTSSIYKLHFLSGMICRTSAMSEVTYTHSQEITEDYAQVVVYAVTKDGRSSRAIERDDLLEPSPDCKSDAEYSFLVFALVQSQIVPDRRDHQRFSTLPSSSRLSIARRGKSRDARYDRSEMTRESYNFESQIRRSFARKR